MAQVLIRNLDDAVVERLRQRADAEGRSLEATLREILTDAARLKKEEVLAEFDRLRARSRPWQPGEPDSTAMIREDRDTR